MDGISSAISPGQAPSGSLDSFLKQYGDLIGEEKQNAATLRQKGSDIVSDIDKTRKQENETPIPKIPELTPVPKIENRDPFQAFGSAASWLAVMGSFMTRQPLVSSLNAAAGVMNAWKQQDAETAKQQFDIWKANNDNAIKLHDFQMENYNAALDKMKENKAAGLAEVQALAASFKDDSVLLLAQKGMGDEAEKLITERDKQYDKMQEMGAKLEAYQNFLQWKSGPEGQKATPEEANKKLMEMTQPSVAAAKERKEGGILADDEYTKLKDLPEVKEMAEDLHKTGDPSKVTRGRATNDPVYQAAMRLHSELYPNETLGDARLGFTEKTAEARTLGNKNVVIQLSSDLLDNSLPILMDRFKDVDNSKWTDLNSFQNYVKQHSNDPKLVALNEAVLATESDLALLIRRGGASTVDSQNRAEKIINNLMNTKAAEAFKDQVELEAKKAQEGAATTEKRLLGNSGSKLKKYTPEEYKKAKADGQLKSGDHFLTSDGVEHVVQ